MLVLTVNAGSSSLKLRLLDGDDALVASVDLPADSRGFDTARLVAAVRDLPAPDAVGHRIVHGGSEFSGPVLVAGEVRSTLEDLVELAPLHQPKSLAALDAVSRALPRTPAVASFDTAFHTTIPAEAATYAIPREWRERYKIHRYGFHGLSHAYCARRVGELLGRPTAELRIVSCHLGAGASVTAVRHGRSVGTTMGFTPLEGLVMATRSGSVDPGLLLWLEEHEHLTPHEIATALETRSGLLALAGTDDMRQVEAAAARDEPDASLALGVYLHRLVGAVATMTAAMGGLDVLAFTGGVGEHSALVRAITVERLGFLGVAIDTAASVREGEDRDISASGAPVSTVVICSREDLEIARQTREALSRATSARARA